MTGKQKSAQLEVATRIVNAIFSGIKITNLFGEKLIHQRSFRTHRRKIQPSHVIDLDDGHLFTDSALYQSKGIGMHLSAQPASPNSKHLERVHLKHAISSPRGLKATPFKQIQQKKSKAQYWIRPKTSLSQQTCKRKVNYQAQSKSVHHDSGESQLLGKKLPFRITNNFSLVPQEVMSKQTFVEISRFIGSCRGARSKSKILRSFSSETKKRSDHYEKKQPQFLDIKPWEFEVDMYA